MDSSGAGFVAGGEVDEAGELLITEHDGDRSMIGRQRWASGQRGVKVALRDRFWDKVDRSGGPDACWEWQAARTTNGYGVVRGDAPRGVSANLRAHRVAWELANGRLLPTYVPGINLELRHKCDNRLCCNPSHLELGTRAQNIADMYERGRANPFGLWRRAG